MADEEGALVELLAAEHPVTSVLCLLALHDAQAGTTFLRV